MVEMSVFGNLVTGANFPGAGYRPGFDPEHSYYNYSPLPATEEPPEDATGGASAPLTPGFNFDPGDSSGAQERGGPGPRPEGFDINQGAGKFKGTGKEFAKRVGPIIMAFLSGPIGMGLYGAKKLAESAYDSFSGPSVSVDWSGADTSGGTEGYSGGRPDQNETSTLGNKGGSRVDESGPSGARDDIGDRSNDRQGDRSTGGSGAPDRGLDDSGRDANLHQGGPVTDKDPSTYRENMKITAQEGEVVMSREAVAMLGPQFFEQINQAAKQAGKPNRGRPLPQPLPQAPQPPAAGDGLSPFAQMAGGAPR